jgi:hypothetical protein
MVRVARQTEKDVFAQVVAVCKTVWLELWICPAVVVTLELIEIGPVVFSPFWYVGTPVIVGLPLCRSLTMTSRLPIRKDSSSVDIFFSPLLSVHVGVDAVCAQDKDAASKRR